MERKRKGSISPLFRENLDVAIKSIKSNRLRSVLTITIIAIGITSLVGVLTTIDALKGSINQSFSKMGASSFNITRKYSQTTSSQRKRVKNKMAISYAQAQLFAEKYDVPSLVTVYTTIGSTETIKYASEKTDPNIQVIATDDTYLKFSLLDLGKGRELSKRDLDNAEFNCVIGATIATTLFGKDDPIGKVITVRAVRYKVIGVLKPVGQSFGGSADQSVYIPISNARALFVNEESNFEIGIKSDPGIEVQFAVDEAERIFRAVRRLSPYDETDFNIRRSDSMLSQMSETMNQVTWASIVISLIILLGAMVGLMNIMLVSVKERTREIGTRKALGATSKLIRQQFFMEAIVIGQIGGLAGMFVGISVGNVVALFLGAPFIIPWVWMLLAVVLCLIVSVVSGFIPAKRAAALDPIEALRYE